MGVVDPAVVPTGRGSSQTEDPGSSLDMAGRADTEQGNRTSTLANTADADSVEEPGQGGRCRLPGCQDGRREA